MRYVWSFFLLEILIYALLKPFISDHEVGLLILIALNIVAVLVFITKFQGVFRFLFFIGFTIRFFIMMIDIYMRGIISIPHSGADTEGFLRRASEISGNFEMIIQSKYEFFIKVVSILFTITENERIIIQYLNVLLGFTAIYLMYLILKKINISRKNMMVGMFIVTFFPHSVFFSGILLREMLSTFFVVSSLYFLVKWYKNNSPHNFVLSMAMILISALFHSGVIGLLLMHIFILIFYKSRTKKLLFSFKSVGMFLIISVFLVSFFGYYEWYELAIFRKLNIESIEDVFDASASRAGGSAYLVGLSINNVFQFLIYGPIFMFYFISSPLPINWRGLNDVMSFSLDGIYYLGTSLYIIFNYKKIPTNKRVLILILIIGLFGALFIFSTGVQNSGTALRHRHKLFFVFTLILIFIKEYKEKIKTKYL